MKPCLAALTLLLGLLPICSCFKPNLPPVKDAQVLVVGASGQVGEQVRRRCEAAQPFAPLLTSTSSSSSPIDDRDLSKM